MDKEEWEINLIRRAVKNYIKDMEASRVARKDLDAALALDKALNDSELDVRLDFFVKDSL
jgi:hypothetical protein